MESLTPVKSDQLIIEAYTAYQDRIVRFINSKIDNAELAKDLSQDTFLRLLEYKAMICQNTVLAMLYMIANNLVIDYLRRHYKKQEITSYLYDCSERISNTTENEIIVKDVLRCERCAISQLPEQRRTIYMMSRFQDLSKKDIAETFKISLRTVDNHLYLGRKEVREYVRKFIS